MLLAQALTGMNAGRMRGAFPHDHKSPLSQEYSAAVLRAFSRIFLELESVAVSMASVSVLVMRLF
jgi:hypothetical protein